MRGGIELLRTKLPLAVTFIAGTTIIAGFFLNIPLVRETGVNTVSSWAVIIAAFALALGAGNVAAVHSRNIRRKGRNWFFSAITLICLFGFLALGLSKGTSDRAYLFIFNSFLVPAQSAVFSLNAFFMTSAAHRTLRIRNWQTLLMVLTVILVALGSVGLGQAVWPALGPIKDWIMTIPNGGGQRGIVIGSSLGVISLGLRIIVGLERGYFGSDV